MIYAYCIFCNFYEIVKIFGHHHGFEKRKREKFDSFLRKYGTMIQLTVLYTPQQYAVAKRLNRTLVEIARCMLLYSGANQNLWADSIGTAVYLPNRSKSLSLCNFSL